MIAKIAQCQRCMTVIYLAEEAGLRWTADLEPLDAQTAVQALVGGKEVYRVTQPGPSLSTAKPHVLVALRTAEPSERPVVVASHGCPTGAAKALKPVLPAEGPGVPGPCVRPGDGRPGPFSGQPTLDGCNGKSCQGCDPAPFDQGGNSWNASAPSATPTSRTDTPAPWSAGQGAGQQGQTASAYTPSDGPSSTSTAGLAASAGTRSTTTSPAETLTGRPSTTSSPATPEAQTTPRTFKRRTGAATKPRPDVSPGGSSSPVCDGCGQPCADGTYASIALGDIIKWAHHVDACGV